MEAAAGASSATTGDLYTDAQMAAIANVISLLTPYITQQAANTQQAAPQTMNQVNSYSIGAATAVDYESNTTTARIGDPTSATPAVVQVMGNISVDANVSDTPVVIAMAGSSGDTGTGQMPTSTQFAGSVAVAIGVYNNTAASFIAANASVDAAGSLSVTSEALNDYQLTYGQNLVPNFISPLTPTYKTGNAGADLVTLNQNNTVQITPGAQGLMNSGISDNWYQYISPVPMTVNLSQQNFNNTNLWKNLGPNGANLFQNFDNNFISYMDNSFGLDNNLVSSWTQANATGTSNAAVAGSVTYLNLNQTSNAYIDSNAKINQNTDAIPNNGKQTVTVYAQGANSSVNLGGSVQTPGIQGYGSKKSA